MWFVTDKDVTIADMEEMKDGEQDMTDLATAAADEATSETDEPEAGKPGAATEKDDESTTLDGQGKSSNGGRRKVSVSIRTLLVGLVVAGLIAAVGVVTWLYIGEKNTVDQQVRQTANNSRAEQMALDYAVSAAKINAQDLDPWKANLVKGTTPELKDKLNGAATQMEQILVPLQWNSTATPLVAKVRSNANGIYVVDTFVSVQTKTVQAPDGLESTATYSVTIDSNHDWQISEVGGVGAVVGGK